MLLALQLNNLLEGGAALVTVPDVVGDTQAAGTTELETALFAVAVANAYSSTVAVGLIIEQSPAGGTDAPEGSTVTITVSLGESSSGGGFYSDFHHLLTRGRKRRQEIEEEAEQVKLIKDETSREIAKILKAEEAQAESKAELARLQALADQYAQIGVPAPRPVLASVMKAHEERSRNALEQMRREIERLFDEEEQAVIALLLMDD
jgi:hypothetical protein